ncbi:hypothetical protein ZHAS_00017444 [Anopheles sinensis]|uniref:Uncharacterized protein n=1 Tax=Anopheles sinensis TaxID=74873 RepID=A0A084WGI2_ANOSI|nr:hypothetical protein ZHAS_00017444 [Anopheles sinensis]
MVADGAGRRVMPFSCFAPRTSDLGFLSRLSHGLLEVIQPIIIIIIIPGPRCRICRFAAKSDLHESWQENCGSENGFTRNVKYLQRNKTKLPASQQQQQQQ